MQKLSKIATAVSFKPTIASATSSFTKALAELEAVEAAEAAKLQKIQTKIDKLRDEQDEAASTKDRASRLRAKFADFLAA